MEVAKQEENVVKADEETKGKKGFLNACLNFLAMGGFLIVLIVIIAIAVLISVLTK